ncbi:MAG: DIP1984 family protein [Drouetiella hepatica Uher 2000/2452]|jgi:hypothetical protein|uniref:DIP1984 family protein n=1 Tax=Drouetiella hepatica Uher 2000/2452 TaxID=904376 RepID=A0A951QHS4_9CYAN|nr:DIP1984 family protein [Drouetiella hepatica Uher 2000/2452]
MKLAEALILRADCQKRLAQLQQRLVRSAVIQEGEAPPENPQVLIAEVDAIVTQLTRLIQQINKTNALTVFQNEETIADALAARDTLLLKQRAYNTLVDAAASTVNRYSASEIKLISTVNVADLQTQTDRLAREIRQLDTQIQQANWNIELME